jgi:hypothetical protein
MIFLPNFANSEIGREIIFFKNQSRKTWGSNPWIFELYLLDIFLKRLELVIPLNPWDYSIQTSKVLYFFTPKFIKIREYAFIFWRFCTSLSNQIEWHGCLRKRHDPLSWMKPTWKKKVGSCFCYDSVMVGRRLFRVHCPYRLQLMNIECLKLQSSTAKTCSSWIATGVCLYKPGVKTVSSVFFS